MFNSETKNRTVSTNEGYHVCKLFFSGIEIIIPQDEVVSIESVYELTPEDENKKHIGEIYKQKARVPVYCFSDAMEVLTQLPEGSSKCVVIRHSEGDFSILCHDVQNIVINDMRFQTLPPCMNNLTMPLTHLCLYKEFSNLIKLGLVTNAECLNGYIKNS